MLIELWEKLRGYDKWVETTPTSLQLDREQYSVRRKGTQVSEYRTFTVLSWLDLNGIPHSDRFKIAHDLQNSRLESSSISLRFNPAAPNQVLFARTREDSAAFI